MFNSWLSLWKLSSEHMDYQKPSLAIINPHSRRKSLKPSWSIWGLSTRRVYRTGRKAMEKWNVVMKPFWRFYGLPDLKQETGERPPRNFCFSTVTPHTVTGMSLVDLFMVKKLRDKLPQAEFYKERVKEAYWQQQLRQRDARAKLRQKAYSEKTRAAKHSNAKAGGKCYWSRRMATSSHLIMSQIRMLSFTRMKCCHLTRRQWQQQNALVEHVVCWARTHWNGGIREARTACAGSKDRTVQPAKIYSETSVSRDTGSPAWDFLRQFRYVSAYTPAWMKNYVCDWKLLILVLVTQKK